jgi:hypothetical protein
VKRLAIALILFAGCSESKTPDPIPPAPQPVVQQPQPAKPAPKPAQKPRQLTPPVSPEEVKFLMEMLAELDEFKSSESFVEFGFGQGAPHYQWLERLTNAKEKHQPGVKRMTYGLLEELGMAYMKSRGQESKLTTHFRKEFNDMIGSR